MKTPIIHLFIAIFLIGGFTKLHAERYPVNNTKKGLSVGYDVNFGVNFYSNDFHVGYKLTDKFDSDRRASWQIGADVNWTKYYLYDNYGFAYLDDPSIYRSASVSFPIILGYEINRSMLSGTKVYAGAVYDLILFSNLDNDPYYNIDYGQWAFTVGTKMKVLGLLDAGVAFKYYPNSLFENGDLNRSAISFSIGF